MERLEEKCQKEQGEKLKEYISRIEGCVRDMRALVDDLAELSSVNRQMLKYDECDIGVVVKEILLEMGPALRQKNGKVSADHLPAIHGDKIQLRILFKNILSNALKFARPNNPLEIKISCSDLTEQEKKDKGLAMEARWYRIEISDNGIGFKQEQALKILQPFTKLHGKSDFPGNGLGLAVSRKIVENNGGILYADGSDKGACFNILLPETPH